MNASLVTIIAVCLVLPFGGCTSATGRDAASQARAAQTNVTGIRRDAAAATVDAKDIQTAASGLRRLLE